MNHALFDFDSVFDAFFGWPDRPRRVVRPATSRTLPELRITEDDNEFRLTASVPGVSTDDVALDVTRDGLSLSVTRGSIVPDGFRAVWRERRPFQIHRTWSSTVPLDADAAEASLENGMLSVRLPKAERTEPRRLTITAT